MRVLMAVAAAVVVVLVVGDKVCPSLSASVCDRGKSLTVL